MEDEIKEYSDAVKANIAACEAEVKAKEKKKLAHYRLVKAREAMRQKESELLEDMDRRLP